MVRNTPDSALRDHPWQCSGVHRAHGALAIEPRAAPCHCPVYLSSAGGSTLVCLQTGLLFPGGPMLLSARQCPGNPTYQGWHLEDGWWGRRDDQDATVFLELQQREQSLSTQPWPPWHTLWSFKCHGRTKSASFMNTHMGAETENDFHASSDLLDPLALSHR